MREFTIKATEITQARYVRLQKSTKPDLSIYLSINYKMRKHAGLVFAILKNSFEAIYLFTAPTKVSVTLSTKRMGFLCKM